MKRSLFLTLVFIFLLTCTAFAEKSKGYIVYENSNIAVIEDAYSSYCGVEIYTGLVNSGDTVIGDFMMYGVQEMYDLNMSSSVNLYVDETMMSKDQAMSWIRKHQ